MFKNLLDVIAGALAFYYVGYGIAFGASEQESSWSRGMAPARRT